MSSDQASQLFPNTIAGYIAELLHSDAKIGDRKVQPGDIAVLVGRNEDARQVQEACAKRNIPAVIYSAANVFASREARELEVIFSAVIDPAHEGRVRAAMATESLGLTSKGLAALSEDEPAWEKLQLRFQRYHKLWREQGFIQMFRTLLLTENVRDRLLRYQDGERRLTNLLHLTELLHTMCVESRLGMTALLKKLTESISTSNSCQNEEHEMRLELDQDSVRIVTVHKSKGLEYNIVFCPYSWRDPWEPKKKEGVIVHDEDKLVFDLEASPENVEKERVERRAENLRLLYVAVTRARHRVHLVWGNLKQGQDSALSYLLGKWSDSQLTALTNSPEVGVEKLATPGVDKFHPSIPDTLTLAARTFTRELDRSHGIVSFTRLVTDRTLEPITPEKEDVEAAEEKADETEQELTGISAFPRGTRAGICLHKIFEEIDFFDLSAMTGIVRDKLESFNLPDQVETVTAMVQRALHVPLLLNNSITLSQIKSNAKLVELEFYFPIGHLRRETLAALFSDERLKFMPMSGFMKGYIDLVFAFESKFYIVDWKSNWLGPDLESYNQSALSAEMRSKFYYLQLHLYTVALQRFLRTRIESYDYERHFGGVFYLFLRGLEPSRPELGVFRARPEKSFIEKLDSILTQ